MRYGGAYAGLPRVPAWEVWNEVNASFFFLPQWKGKPGGEALSPVLYRTLVNAFADAVHGVNPANLVIAGSLYPFSLDRPNAQAIPPLKFMRYLFCLSQKLKLKPNCGEPMRFDVWSHHPYTSGSPTHDPLGPESVSIGQLGRMGSVLRAAVRQGRVISSHPVQYWVTEFGWDTNPPDPKGVPVRLQARWISEAFYRMWRAGVSLASWFQMRDGFGDGARFADGLYSICPEQPENLSCDRAKISFVSFRFPFVAFRRDRRHVLIWGRTPSGVPGTVVVEQSRGGAFKRLVTIRQRPVRGLHANAAEPARREPARAPRKRLGRLAAVRAQATARFPDKSAGGMNDRADRNGQVDVSVLTPVLNEEAHIRETVADMRTQDFEGAVEFLFMDGRSEDATRAILDELAREDPRIRVIDNPGRGISQGLNVGLQHARGEYVARMDAHTHYPPRYLARGVERLQTGDVAWVAGAPIPAGAGEVVTPRLDRASLAARRRGLAKMGDGGRDRARHRCLRRSLAAIHARAARGLGRGLGRQRGLGAGRPLLLGRRPDRRAAGARGPLHPARQHPRPGASVRPLRLLPREDGAAPPWQHAPLALASAGARRDRGRRSCRPPARSVTSPAWASPSTSPRSPRGAPEPRTRVPRDRGALPLVFATMHASWGAGFLAGAARFGPPLAAVRALFFAVAARIAARSTEGRFAA